MNKLLVDNMIITKQNNNLVINGKQNITIFNQEVKTLKIKVTKNSEAIINDFRLINKANTKVQLVADEGASLIYNHAFINRGSYYLIIKASYLGTKSNMMINIHGLNDGGETNLTIDGVIEEHNQHNLLAQNIKLMNVNGGKAKALPNMLVKSLNVIANHNVTVGKLEKNELNYLMSKGLSTDTAKKLIINGFLVNVLSDSKLIIKVKELIGGR